MQHDIDIQQSASTLSPPSINCLTYIKAIRCGEVGATIVSPFVGRILDWHVKKSGRQYASSEDPGVVSVKEIYRLFKKRSFKTNIMAASFRNVGQILELAGIDLLTISPKLMGQLSTEKIEVTNKITDDSNIHLDNDGSTKIDHETFQLAFDNDQCARELLKNGIERFDEDARKLEQLLQELSMEL